MKFIQLIALTLFLFCTTQVRSQITVEPEDKQILERVFNQLKNDADKSTSELVVLTGKAFKETPYVAHTLEKEPELLVVNLRELDCTTFAENCLAIARTVKKGDLTFDNFAKELSNIRYRKGEVDGYLSRLHYFSDWIYQNDKKGLVRSVSQAVANTPYPLELDFMSTHADSYKQLKNNAEWVPILAKKEKEISQRSMYFIPKDKLPNFEKELKEGDIIGICTSIKGLDITHVGIVVIKNGRVHLMHASSKAEKVIISEKTLHEYLLGRKSATGIMLARPQ